MYVDEEDTGTITVPGKSMRTSRADDAEQRVPGSASNGWVVMKTLKELQVINLR